VTVVFSIPSGLKDSTTWNLTIVTSVAENEMIPKEFALAQNYPNPFNPTTTIEYQVPGVGIQYIVSLRVFDLLGREVVTLVNERKPAGSYTKQWNANGMPNGIYFYRLTASSFTETKKLVLLK
jgi:hypothetical protein